MNFLVALVLIVAPADQAKAPVDQGKDVPTIEQALKSGAKAGGDPITVKTHILVHQVKGNKELSVKFVDAKGSANVNIKEWDSKLKELKPETLLTVTGQLHFGPVRGGTPSIRYKVRDSKGKKYNDHQHWRTDKAIYIVNPTYVISGAKETGEAIANDAKEPKETEPADSKDQK